MKCVHNILFLYAQLNRQICFNFNFNFQVGNIIIVTNYFDFEEAMFVGQIE